VQDDFEVIVVVEPLDHRRRIRKDVPSKANSPLSVFRPDATIATVLNVKRTRIDSCLPQETVDVGVPFRIAIPPVN
jgi:hypothetical protein